MMPTDALKLAIEAAREERGKCKDEITRLREELEEAREAMESITKVDKTPHYEYGEPDRLGQHTLPGRRWLQPREIAREWLSRHSPEAEE